MKHTNVRCIGLCNVPVNMQADAVKALHSLKEKLICRFAGLNHFSFLTEARLDGEDVLGTLMDALGRNETLMKNIPKVAGVGELIHAIGVIPSPYLQYYYFEHEMRKKQQMEWKSEQMTRAAAVHAIDEKLFAQYADSALCKKPEELSQRGGSLYSFAALNIIEALLGGEKKEMAVNFRNQGAIPDLRWDDVVEASCYVSQTGVERISFPPMPEAVAGLLQTVKQYERLTVEAAVKRDRRLAVQALLNHPLIHGYANAAQVVQLLENHFPKYIYWREG